MMKRHMHRALLPFTVLLLAAGCGEQRLSRIDRLVADVNQTGQAIAAIPDGPAGPVIPDELRLILELVGVGTAGAYGLWQRIRASRLLERKQNITATLADVVKVIEQIQLERPELAAAIKGRIARLMARGSPANQLIDEIKSALPDQKN
jgi:hypothetical protein